jgi:hypothetical protein
MTTYTDDIHSDIEGDILPSQYFATMGSGGLSAEQRLMLAVLVDALNVLQSWRGVGSGRKRRDFAEAARWVNCVGTTHPFSFDSVCDALEINSELLRSRLRELTVRPANSPRRPSVARLFLRTKHSLWSQPDRVMRTQREVPERSARVTPTEAQWLFPYEEPAYAAAPDKGSFADRGLVLSRYGAVSIGSADDNDVIIQHPTVSRHHAVITRCGMLQRRKLSDLNSSNGTAVNGRSIKRPVPFHIGDSVRLGAVSMRFYWESVSPARHTLLLAAVLGCLFIGGFAVTEYQLFRRREPELVRTKETAAPVEPGVVKLPLIRSQQVVAVLVRQQEAIAQRGSLAAIPGAVVDAAAAQIPAYPSDSDWLAEINRWRSASGTAPIGESPVLSAGSSKHAEYLVKNGPSSATAFSQYASALGGAAHMEDAGNPYFTPAGYEAAQVPPTSIGPAATRLKE